jgi:hypothetical protein
VRLLEMSIFALAVGGLIWACGGIALLRRFTDWLVERLAK